MTEMEKDRERWREMENEKRQSKTEKSKKYTKNHMDRGFRCSIDIIHYCDVKVMGQQPQRGQ